MMRHPLDDPLDLLGCWQWSRTIDDHLEASRIAATGTAHFVTAGPDRIAWREEGALHLADGPVPVTTDRLLTRDDAGHWSVNFADGREFHPWLVGAELIHDCAPDLYRGRIDGGRGAASPTRATASDTPSSDRDRDRDDWTLRWAAVGPAKDYTMVTVYRRPTAV